MKSFKVISYEVAPGGKVFVRDSAGEVIGIK